MTAIVLTIGGSDSGGGAGIQADIKTFSVLGVHGVCAITAVTAQNTIGVQHVFGLESDAVRAQLQSITDDFSVTAAKTGMLYSAEIVMAVADHLRDKDIPLVVDPVIEAEAGGRLLRPEAAIALKEHLLPLADVITPNIFEAEALSGVSVRDKKSAILAARRILEMGGRAVIIKGGHLDCTDLLATKEMSQFLPGHRVAGENHGVGCTYSAALTAFLACGSSLPQAAGQAKRFAEEALMGSMRVGNGVGPVGQAASLRKEAERYRIVCNIQKAADHLLKSPDLLKFNEPGISLGMALSASAELQDVAELEGGLRRVGGTFQCGGIRFGRGSLLSRIILAAQKLDPSAVAAMSLSPLAWRACQAFLASDCLAGEAKEGDISGWEGICKDMREAMARGGCLPKAVLERDSLGRGTRLWLLGSSATDLAERAVGIAGNQRDGKI